MIKASLKPSPTSPEPQPEGRLDHGEKGRRRAPLGGLIGLAAALVAAGALLALSPDGNEPTPPQTRTVGETWPDARRADIPGTLPDGTAYNPAYFLDERTSVGTAPDASGGSVRLVLRAADGTIRELRRLPSAVGPQFAGFTRAGDDLAWAESATGKDGATKTTMWRVGVAAGGAPLQITDDTGDVVFFNSEYDMLIERGRLYWAAVAPGRDTATEVRSAPLTGGPVDVRTEPGAWALSGWPWLVSAGSGQSGPVRMRDLDSGREQAIDATANELVTCGPTWCRVLVLAGNGPARSELMRPDGADRQQVATGTATASIIDVAVLDRFEVLSEDSSSLAQAVGGQRLVLYDLKTKQTSTVADTAGMVLYRGGVLWWSTGDEGQTTAWHTLDLRSLS
ncbi:hypothetical protein WEI85_08290 [Actinomycetes bacterium KLBMP 9797]